MKKRTNENKNKNKANYNQQARQQCSDHILDSYVMLVGCLFVFCFVSNAVKKKYIPQRESLRLDS